MLGIIHGNPSMLLAMQVVLVLIGLTIVVRMVMSLRTGVNVSDLAGYVLNPVLYEIFPLILISLLTIFDPTKVLVMIAYYLAALLIAIRALLELAGLVKSK